MGGSLTIITKLFLIKQIFNMDSGCRLCNSNLMLINIFELPLQDTVQIKKCIEIASGVSIHQDDEMGKFVCKHCCDITILCYKFRQNAQKNAIRIREQLLKIKRSNLLELQSTAYRSPATKFEQNSAYVPKSTASTSITQCNISPSMSHILLNYPSLKVPKELFTESILPVVQLQNIKLLYKIDSDGQVNLRSDFNQYRITQVNHTKLRLKKFSRQKRGDSFCSSGDATDWNDNAGIMLNNSFESVASSSKSFNTRSKAYKNSLNATESEANLLIPVTYRDEFMCNICNEMLESNMQLELHMQNCHKVNNAKNNEDSSSESSKITLKKLTNTELPKRKSRKRKRKTVVEKKRIRDSSTKFSDVNCSTDIVILESVPVNSESEVERFQREMVLELVRIEEDENIRRDYPYIFDRSPFNSSALTNNEDDLSTTDNNDETMGTSVSQSPTFRSLWAKALTSTEKQKVQDFFLSFVRTRIPGNPIKRKPVVILKNAEVQTVTELDSTLFKLDLMGTNEMDVLIPELRRYNVPVSIIKPPTMKDVVTAFYIQYSPTETSSKPIDWSKLPKIDLQRQMRSTSTPFSNADADFNDTPCPLPLPSLISLKDMVYCNRNED